ncbi:MAG: YqgE/AlgH family protein [Alphaproteobacteria bacterium]|nr:YqgE/AlgH family protein [Alphaproteobacteria bacterium]
MAASGYLTGQLLIAMPTISDPRFARSVILVCAHSEEGAMGILLNKRTTPSISFVELLRQLSIPPRGAPRPVSVQYGGPVDMARGFVLHSSDYHGGASSLQINREIQLTATMDILKDLADGSGPQQAVLALGYAGWGAQQLDKEIGNNSWLSCEPDPALLFGADLEGKWAAAMQKLGVDLSKLSGNFGRA